LKPKTSCGRRSGGPPRTLKANSPEGFVLRVYVTLDNGEMIEPGAVEYISSWLFFEMDRPGDEVTEERRVIAIHPDRIGHVEIRPVRSTDAPSVVGFRVTTSE